MRGNRVLRQLQAMRQAHNARRSRGRSNRPLANVPSSIRPSTATVRTSGSGAMPARSTRSTWPWPARRPFHRRPDRGRGLLSARRALFPDHERQHRSANAQRATGGNGQAASASARTATTRRGVPRTPASAATNRPSGGRRRLRPPTGGEPVTGARGAGRPADGADGTVNRGFGREPRRAEAAGPRPRSTAAPSGLARVRRRRRRRRAARGSGGEEDAGQSPVPPRGEARSHPPIEPKPATPKTRRHGEPAPSAAAILIRHGEPASPIGSSWPGNMASVAMSARSVSGNRRCRRGDSAPARSPAA